MARGSENRAETGADPGRAPLEPAESDEYRRGLNGGEHGCHRRYPHLEQAVERSIASVLRQSFRRFTLVVSASASGDDTAGVVPDCPEDVPARCARVLFHARQYRRWAATIFKALRSEIRQDRRIGLDPWTGRFVVGQLGGRRRRGGVRRMRFAVVHRQLPARLPRQVGRSAGPRPRTIASSWRAMPGAISNSVET